MSPRMPTLSLKNPMIPAPALNPKSVLSMSPTKSSMSVTLVLTRPTPPEAYGRTAPSGAPMTRLAMKVVTFPSPVRSKSSSSGETSKKFGE